MALKVKDLKDFYLLEHDDVVLMLQLINHYGYACPQGLHFDDMMSLLTKGINHDRRYTIALLNRMAVTDLVIYDIRSQSYGLTNLGKEYLWDEYKNI